MQFVCRFTFVLAFLNATLVARAQTPYSSDGTPAGIEEEIRWRLNRGRFDSASENATRGTSYSDVPASSGPLAPNQSITLAARHQSEDMAKMNVFQHATVPGSFYYNAVTQPNPWDRMSAEGYSWNSAGENIAAGYSGAEAAYVGWWNSSGHRANMYNGGLREIGNGFYNWSTSTYRNYYTMDLGSSGNNCFFTDTLFRDANGNGVYEQGEAVAGVAIRLIVGTTTFSAYDVSSAVGSFAIPIQTIASGALVQVVLSNTTASALTLSIPRDYLNYTTVPLASGESRVYGTFTRPTTTRNTGLRDVTTVQNLLVAPRLGLVRAGSTIRLSWASESGLQYQPQWTTNFVVWSGLTNGFMAGTGGSLSFSDSALNLTAPKYYRLLVRTP